MLHLVDANGLMTFPDFSQISVTGFHWQTFDGKDWADWWRYIFFIIILFFFFAVWKACRMFALMEPTLWTMTYLKLLCYFAPLRVA